MKNNTADNTMNNPNAQLITNTDRVVSHTYIKSLATNNNPEIENFWTTMHTDSTTDCTDLFNAFGGAAAV